MEKLRCVLIGCGGIGSYHLGNLMKHEDIAEVVGFCDLIPEKTEKFVGWYHGRGKRYTDYKVMYDELKPDAAFICVPPYCHGEIEFETIKRGIHFFVEKPVTLDLDLAYEIRDKIAEAGLITAVGFQCRYHKINDSAIRFCRSNEIAFISCTRFGGVPEAFWWKDKSLSGGQLVEQTIHNVDAIRYIAGEVEEVCSFNTSGFVREIEDYKTDDLTTTIFRMKSGALGTVSSGCYSLNGNSFKSSLVFSSREKRCEYYLCDRVEIFGESAEEAEKSEGFVIKGDGGLGSSGEAITYRFPDDDFGAVCDRTFLEAVISGDPSKIRSPYSDAVKTLALVLACNKSMQTHKPEKVDIR